MVNRGAPAERASTRPTTLASTPCFCAVSITTWACSGRGVHLHSVAHVVDLIHLSPCSAAVLLNQLEQGRRFKKAILDNVKLFVCKVEHLGLASAAAVDQPVKGALDPP